MGASLMLSYKVLSTLGSYLYYNTFQKEVQCIMRRQLTLSETRDWPVYSVELAGVDVLSCVSGTDRPRVG
jgi:hypothetical protein